LSGVRHSDAGLHIFYRRTQQKPAVYSWDFTEK